MNERIQLLAEQAMGTRKHVPPVWQFYDIELEKFAELIVQECIDIIEKVPPGYRDYRNSIEDSFREYSIAKIKQHFRDK